MGSNLNQVVRLAHTAGVDPQAVARIEVAVAAAREALRAVHAQLMAPTPAPGPGPGPATSTSPGEPVPASVGGVAG